MSLAIAINVYRAGELTKTFPPLPPVPPSPTNSNKRHVFSGIHATQIYFSPAESPRFFMLPPPPFFLLMMRKNNKKMKCPTYKLSEAYTTCAIECM